MCVRVTLVFARQKCHAFVLLLRKYSLYLFLGGQRRTEFSLTLKRYTLSNFSVNILRLSCDLNCRYYVEKIVSVNKNAKS